MWIIDQDTEAAGKRSQVQSHFSDGPAVEQVFLLAHESNLEDLHPVFQQHLEILL